MNAPRWILDDFSPGLIKQNGGMMGKKLRILTGKTKQSVSGPILLNDVFDSHRFDGGHSQVLNQAFASFQLYQPERFSGTVSFFRASHRPLLHSLSKDLGWARFADRVDVHSIRSNQKVLVKLLTQPIYDRE